MQVKDLESQLDWASSVPKPETSVFVDDDALAECALLDVRLDMINSDVRLLFDCRGALQLQDGNVAVVAIRHVTSLRWDSVDRERRTWRAVVGSKSTRTPGSIGFTVWVEPTGRLDIIGKTGAFVVGNVSGGDEAPPDFVTATDAEVRTGMATWESEFEIVSAVLLE